jgi:hypothetical protein
MEIRMRKVFPLIIAGVLIFSAMGLGNAVETKDFDNAYDLLIIAPGVFYNELQPLIKHKNELGVDTKMVVLRDVYKDSLGRDPAERIKYFIKYAIETWGIEYVLLVGGRKPSIYGEEWLLPVRYSHIEDNVAVPEDRYISDLYYADIYDREGGFSSWDTNRNMMFGEWHANESADDIIDLYPDVYVGRLPCRDKLEVEIMVNKIIEYENGRCDDSWFKRMVVAGGDTYTFNDYFEGEVANQQALDFMSDFEPVKLWASDGSLRSWRDVVREINRGCGFLYLAGHGGPGAWGTHPPYDNSTWIYGLRLQHMPFLFNGWKLPVCVVGGCHNSMFNISIFHSSWTHGVPVPECWSWWLTRKIGGGSIATLGCTGLGYGKEDKQGPVKEGGGDWLDVLFFKEYGEKHIDILGKVWGNAISSYLDEFPIDWSQRAFNDTALDAKTVQEWVLLGDPSLKIGGYS